MNGLMLTLAMIQGAYFLATGIWPLLHLASFMRVTGPKTDRWLVKTVGALVAVLLPLPVDTAYDYLVPEGAAFRAGDIVEVPLGRRFEVGVVWGAGAGDVRRSS